MIPWEEFLTDREIYVLQHWPFKTYEAIGQDFGVSAARVKKIRNDAERKIREKIREEHPLRLEDLNR